MQSFLRSYGKVTSLSFFIKLKFYTVKFFIKLNYLYCSGALCAGEGGTLRAYVGAYALRGLMHYEGLCSLQLVYSAKRFTLR